MCIRDRLKGRENFFHRMNLHLIQADNTVQQDLLIRKEDELIHAMNHFQLRGGGGTDLDVYKRQPSTVWPRVSSTPI